jgi:hypothetical protein
MIIFLKIWWGKLKYAMIAEFRCAAPVILKLTN